MPSKGRTRNSSWKTRQVPAPSSAPSFNSAVLSRNLSTENATPAVAPPVTSLNNVKAPAKNVSAQDVASSAVSSDPSSLTAIPSVTATPSIPLVVTASAFSTAPSTSLSANASAPNASTDVTANLGDTMQSSVTMPSSLLVPIPQDDGPDATTVTDPAMHKKAVELPNQHSKTSIGRLTYNMDQPSNIYVLKVYVETDINAATTPVWEPVKSRQLRQLAVKKWLEHPEIAAIRHLLKVDVRENEEGAVYIIVRVRDAEHKTEVKNRLHKIPPTIPGLTKKTLVDGNHVEQTIRCMRVIHEPAVSSVDASFKRNLPNIPGGIESYTSDPLKGISADINSLLQSCERVSPITPLGYTLNLRCKPTVDDEQQTLALGSL
jgi:hypothetical protein